MATKKAISLYEGQLREVNQTDEIADAVNSLGYKFSGRDYSLFLASDAPTTQGLAVNTLRTFPFIITKKVTFTQIRIQVSTAAASSLFRIGVYADSGNGVANQLVTGSDTIQFDGNTTAVQTQTFAAPITLEPGLYWLAVACGGIATTLRSVPLGSIANVLGLNPAMGTSSQYTGRTVAFTLGPLPATHPGGSTNLSNTNAPMALFRVQ